MLPNCLLVRTGTAREIYERNTPVESFMDLFSDRGSTPLASTIKVNIRWYKKVISLRGDFFVCNSRKSFIYKGFRLFLFLCSIQYCPGKPSRIPLRFCSRFHCSLFWNLPLPWGFHSKHKVLHGFKTLYLLSSKIIFICTPTYICDSQGIKMGLDFFAF